MVLEYFAHGTQIYNNVSVISVEWRSNGSFIYSCLFIFMLSAKGMPCSQKFLIWRVM